MIARVVWVCILAVIAGITAQLQLDRQSARDPAMTAFVAAPFLADAQPAITREALVAGDPATALAEARRLVEQRPIPAEHLSMLARAYLISGDPERAEQAMTNAAMRGWRDLEVQEAMARLALAYGDLPEATRRFAALMVGGKDNDLLLQELAGAIFAERGSPAHTTMADILQGADRWFGVFLRRGPNTLPADTFVDLVLENAEADGPIECDKLVSPIRSLSRRNEAAAMRLITGMRDRCPGIENAFKPLRARRVRGS